MTNPIPDPLRLEVENAIFDLLKKKYSSREIEPGRMREIANKVLLLIPEDISHEKLLATIPTLDDEMTELAEVVRGYMEKHDQEIRDNTIPQVQALIASFKKK